MKRFFHYTTESRIREIIDSGHIKLATQSTFHRNEKPVAWVSTNPEWENKATKMAVDNFGRQKKLTFDEQLELFGCARIEVKGNTLYTWAKLRHKANMDIKAASIFEFTGKKQGANSEEWFGSLKPIKKHQWIKAEVFKDGKWVCLKEFND